jgi:hypothetical protein
MLTTQSTVIVSLTQYQLAILQGGTAIIQEQLRQEEEEAARPKKHGGSRKGRSANIQRDFEAGYARLYQDYFSETPLYSDYLFQRRFRMHRNRFMKIVHDVTEYDSYFVRKQDAVGKLGLYPIQKITSAM